MANTEEDQLFFEVCEIGPSILLAPVDPIHTEDEEVRRKKYINIILSRRKRREMLITYIFPADKD